MLDRDARFILAALFAVFASAIGAHEITVRTAGFREHAGQPLSQSDSSKEEMPRSRGGLLRIASIIITGPRSEAASLGKLLRRVWQIIVNVDSAVREAEKLRFSQTKTLQAPSRLET